MKTCVELTIDLPIAGFKKGDRGYIDSYVQRGNSTKAVVILKDGSFNIFDLSDLKFVAFHEKKDIRYIQ